jgi:transcriptional regulator with XRE-family HTH domain
MCYTKIVNNLVFSDIVKKARKEAKLSQQEMASALNVSFATINRWENKKTMPTKLAKLAFENFCREKGIETGAY